MLLIHRLTPFAIGVVIAVGFILTATYPLSAPWLLPAMFVLAVALIWRLAEFKVKDSQRWALTATPIFFLLSAIGLFVLVEDGVARTAIAIVTTVLTFLYAEHLFRFVHLPAVYQAYGLQNIASVMIVLTFFLFASAGEALATFVRPPLPLSALGIFFLVFVSTYNAFWTAKAPRDRALTYALAGAILFTELFVAVSFFPTAFLTEGALLTILYYVYIGLSRAHVLAKLSRVVIRNYVGVAALVLLALLATASWT